MQLCMKIDVIQIASTAAFAGDHPRGSILDDSGTQIAVYLCDDSPDLGL